MASTGVGGKEDMSARVDGKLSQWFGHVERVFGDWINRKTVQH